MPVTQSDYKPIVVSTEKTETKVDIIEDVLKVMPKEHYVKITPICPSCSNDGNLKVFETFMQNDILSYNLPEIPNKTPIRVYVNGVLVRYKLDGVVVTIVSPYLPSDVTVLDHLVIDYYTS